MTLSDLQEIQKKSLLENPKLRSGHDKIDQWNIACFCPKGDDLLINTQRKEKGKLSHTAEHPEFLNFLCLWQGMQLEGQQQL